MATKKNSDERNPGGRLLLKLVGTKLVVLTGPQSAMNKLLSSFEAAERLGIAVATLYEWLSQSDVGRFHIRGQRVNIEYYQGGRRGQGRIRVPKKEVERLLSMMRVSPRQATSKPHSPSKPITKHITVALGRPDD